MTTVVIQPDGAAGCDNYLYDASADANAGGNAELGIGENNAAVAKNRTLIKFDLSVIPASAKIASATLSLYCYQDNCSTARTHRVYRLLRAWTELGSTWNKYDGANNWATAGGFGAADCEQNDIGTRDFGVNDAINEFKNYPLTAAKVQEMVSGAFTNNGFLIKADGELDDAYYFRSSDYGTAADRPKLTVEYSLAGGSPMWWF